MFKFKSIAGVSAFCALLSACATPVENTADTNLTDADLEACITQAQNMMVGTWDYVSIIERISGGYRTFSTRSIHYAPKDALYSSRAFGGDIEESEEDSELEYERIAGNQIFQVVDGEDQIDRARTFLTCEDPDDVGRIKTTSTYQFPLDEEGSEMLTANNYSSFSDTGTFFFEEILDENGEIIARVSGVTTPVDGS